jgi:tRNA(Ile)-lysidine synthase
MDLREGNLLSAVRRTMTRHGLFSTGATVVVAVSGGPDSTALLHALAALRAEWGVPLVGAHLNHGFRGPEAAGDAEYVVALCRDLGIPCHCEQFDVPALQRRRHLSAQAAAREVRHAFLRRVATDVGAAYIALGHTRDDRIETVLLNILRGSGLDGIAGMAVSDPPLIRPLLDVSRAEVETYCALHALHPRHDSSNLKTDYRRNRLRAELLPHLTSYYNQCVGDAVLRLSDLAAAELAREALRTVTLTEGDVDWVLDAEALSRLPLALRRRVLRLAIAELRGDLRDVGMESTERILDAVTAQRQESVTLPACEAASVEVMVALPTVRIRRLAPTAQSLPWRYTLDVPGELDLPQAALVLEIRRCPSLAAAFEFASRREEALVYCRNEIVLPLSVRSWLPGDRFRPRGLGGSKKLQDLFTDRKIRGEARLRFPVLTDATGRVLAVVGLQPDETALRLSALPSEPVVEGEYLVLSWK